MKKTVWVVVADEAIARILQWPDEGGDLQPVEELTDPATHASNAVLRRDAHGRGAGSVPGSAPPGNRPGMRGTATVASSAGERAKHLEAESFARRVAQRLAEGLQQRRFDELHIAAAPRFLGLLRKAVSPQVAATVRQEADKDLVMMSNREITERLFPGRAP